MKEEDYNAKEAMDKLKLATTTFYRKVKEGHIPYTGRRPNMRFPKEAIDAIAELESDKEPVDKLIFKQATVADIWDRRKIITQAYDIKEAIPFKSVLAWRKRNSQISMQLNKGSKILGWSTFLPLEEEIILRLIEDKMKEEDIPPQAVRKWDEPQISVYIPTVEVAETINDDGNRVIAAFLLKKTIKWANTLAEQYDIKNWYAIGTDQTDQAILDALGFKHIKNLDGGKRKAYRLDDLLSKPSKLVKRFSRKP